jgi:hypothetical protein
LFREIFIAGNEFEKSKSLIFDVDFYMSDLKKEKIECVTIVPPVGRR